MAGSIQLDEAFGRASQAARRGDIVELEVVLSELRRARVPELGVVANRLRAVAAAVRAHPSFRSSLVQTT